MIPNFGAFCEADRHLFRTRGLRPTFVGFREAVWGVKPSPGNSVRYNTLCGVVVELADTADSKSAGVHSPSRFDPEQRHHLGNTHYQFRKFAILRLATTIRRPQKPLVPFCFLLLLDLSDALGFCCKCSCEN